MSEKESHAGEGQDGVLETDHGRENIEIEPKKERDTERGRGRDRGPVDGRDSGGRSGFPED